MLLEHACASPKLRETPTSKIKCRRSPELFREDGRHASQEATFHASVRTTVSPSSKEAKIVANRSSWHNGYFRLISRYHRGGFFGFVSNVSDSARPSGRVKW